MLTTLLAEMARGEALNREGLALAGEFIHRHPTMVEYFRADRPSDSEQAEAYNSLIARAQAEAARG